MQMELAKHVSLAALAWQTGAVLPWVALGAIVLVGMAGWLYRRQRAAAGRWRWILVGLRAAGLVAVVSSIARPALIRPRTAEQRGVVAILVDHSHSQEVRDFGGDSDVAKAQLVAVADMLGRLPGGARSSVAGLYDDVQKIVAATDDALRLKNELDFAPFSGRDRQAAQGRVDAALAAMIDAANRAANKAAELGAGVGRDLTELARSMERSRGNPNLPHIRERATAVRDRTLESQVGFDYRLYQRNAEVRRICDELAAMSRYRLVELALLDPKKGLLAALGAQTPVLGFAFADDVVPLALKAGGTPVDRLGVDPYGPSTDLDGAVRSVAQQLGSRPIQAIIVFSDGRQVGAPTMARLAAVPSRVPVFTVVAAGPPARDLAIAHVRMPRSAFVGETITVRLELRATGIEARELVGLARLSVGGVEAAPQPLRLKDGRLEPLEFQAKVEAPGVQRVTVALPQLRGEVTFDNNTAQRYLKVVAQKVRVALISSSPGWDWRYLRNALARTPWIELTEALLDRDEDRLDLSTRKIADQDVVILDDVNPRALSAEQWDAVHRLVNQRGGGVILMAGDAHLPAEYATEPLSDFLPYKAGAKAAWRIWPGEDAHYRAQVAASATSVEALKLDGDPEENRRRWDGLGAFYRYLSMPALKPVTPLLVERESQAPLLTEARLGRGRVLFLGMNETWRWRQKVGERDQDRLWLGLIRHAMDEPYAVSDSSLLLDADRLSVAPGESVRVRAKLAGGMPEALMPDSLTLQVLRGGVPVRTEEMLAVSQSARGQYEVVLAERAVGDYDLRVAPFNDNTDLASVLPLRVAYDEEAEMADLSADEEHLRRLTQAGGTKLSIQELGALPRLLAEVNARQPGVTELPLWDSYYLFFLVLGCLGTEWGIRKKIGMA